MQSRVKTTIEFFGPQWFGSTMGTGVLGIALSLIATRIDRLSRLKSRESSNRSVKR
ncbi:hypothetical protein SAMN05421752_1451 [Natronorubrum thiooxidans]|uniref:Uncharacterized protein n=1 Tax=Natronorubrum thiooxidans TaxID=308853 RepID=A0A1N7HAX0_9EURY|nr:hypothetical protein SAMN05421752_1451 [Natronorubrum thiooxidans]